jgi:hypothetical protein
MGGCGAARVLWRLGYKDRPQRPNGSESLLWEIMGKVLSDRRFQRIFAYFYWVKRGLGGGFCSAMKKLGSRWGMSGICLWAYI